MSLEFGPCKTCDSRQYSWSELYGRLLSKNLPRSVGWSVPSTHSGGAAPRAVTRAHGSALALGSRDPARRHAVTRARRSQKSGAFRLSLGRLVRASPPLPFPLLGALLRYAPDSSLARRRRRRGGRDIACLRRRCTYTHKHVFR